MKKIKETLLFILIAIALFWTLNGYKAIAAEAKLPLNTLYTTDHFELFGKDSNLIINSFSHSENEILIDAYLLNNSGTDINEIKNLNLLVKDANGNVCFDGNFPSLEIKNPIKPNTGVKINLVTPMDDFDASKLDFSSINYSFYYDYN